jgi:hypothetical protein
MRKLNSLLNAQDKRAINYLKKVEKFMLRILILLFLQLLYSINLQHLMNLGIAKMKIIRSYSEVHNAMTNKEFQKVMNKDHFLKKEDVLITNGSSILGEIEFSCQTCSIWLH